MSCSGNCEMDFASKEIAGLKSYTDSLKIKVSRENIFADFFQIFSEY